MTKKITCLILALLLFNLTPLSALADVGVQPVLPGGSNLKPGQETPIRMAAETVTMNVRLATAADNELIRLNPQWYGYNLHPVWFTAMAEVEAVFTLHNPTAETIGMTVWFPLASALESVSWRMNPGEIVPTILSFQVSANTIPLEYTVSELPNPKGADRPPLPWASFAVQFAPQADTLLRVTYAVPLQPYPKEPLMALYYIFQTGAGWAGTIGQAELIVNLPYPASVETLAGRGKLSLPPIRPSGEPGLPVGVTLQGNQARWTWQDFEPGPEDDFSLVLVQIDKWQALETHRAAVKQKPADGQAWLELAQEYYSLVMNGMGRLNLCLFSPAYLPQGLQAYQQAARLLPEHPVPHLGLALFNLAPYVEKKNAPARVLTLVEDEYRLAKELSARHPELAQDWMMNFLEDVLSGYYYNDATATQVALTKAVEDLTRTAIATRDYATTTALYIQRATGAVGKATNLACWAATGKQCTATLSPTVTDTPTLTLTVTHSPTRTPTPTLSLTPALLPGTPAPLATVTIQAASPGTPGGWPAGWVAGVVVGALLLAGAGYWITKRRRRK